MVGLLVDESATGSVRRAEAEVVDDSVAVVVAAAKVERYLTVAERTEWALVGEPGLPNVEVAATAVFAIACDATALAAAVVTVAALVFVPTSVAAAASMFVFASVTAVAAVGADFAEIDSFAVVSLFSFLY